jgi:RNA polymerase sigma factor (sigma-70 family)
MINSIVTQMNDEEILDRMFAGENALYEILIRRYNPLLYKIGRSYGFLHEDTQDLMQDTYITAYQHLSEFQRKSQWGTWLAKIMINKCLYKIKTSQRMQLTTLEDEKMISIERTILQQELGNVMEKAIEALPENLRMVFLLREVQGLSVMETAEILNITAVNVKVRLNRAKAQLQKKLEKWYSRADIYEFNLVYCSQVVVNVLKEVGKPDN